MGLIYYGPKGMYFFVCIMSIQSEKNCHSLLFCIQNICHVRSEVSRCWLRGVLSSEVWWQMVQLKFISEACCMFGLLKMETVWSSKMLMNFNCITWRHIWEDGTLNIYHYPQMLLFLHLGHDSVPMSYTCIHRILQSWMSECAKRMADQKCIHKSSWIVNFIFAKL
jgi:hypothetical protein